MRNYLFTASLVLLSLLAQAQLPVTTTLTAQTANNTSAADTFAGQTNGNPAAGNVSKLSLHSLLYAGSTTKIYAHVEPWWGSSSHVSIGYSSQDPAQVHRQVQDMVSRGIDGVVVDWYGPGSYEDTGVQMLVNEAQSTPNFSLIIEIDVGAINWHSCYPTCSATTAAVNLFTQLNTEFLSSPAIAKMNGRPMVMEFGMETLTLPSGAASGWNVIDWNAVETQVPGNLAFLHRNLGGYTKAGSVGAFPWMEPEAIANFTAGFDDTSDLTWFYSNSVSSYPTMSAFGATWKGFNDTIADWSGNRHIDQNCGQTWLRTFNTVNQYYSATKQLPALQLVTWNDYEEGTEVETGIDNCLSLTSTLSGSQLQWSAGGDESTVDHYTVYASTDGQNLASLGDFATGTHSVDLSAFTIPAGSYKVYVQAIGKPTIRNQMSAAVSYTVAAPITTPTTSGSGTTTSGTGTTGTSGTGTTTTGSGATAVAKSVSITAAPPAQTVARGTAGQYTLTVNETGATDAVQLSCSGLPAGMACSFSSANVTPAAAGTQVQLSVSTTGLSAELQQTKPVFAMIFSGLGLFGALARSKRRKLIAIAVLMGILILTQVACGGGSMNTSSASTPTTVTTAPTTAPSTTYTITVTATSGTAVHSTPITLTVN